MNSLTFPAPRQLPKAPKLKASLEKRADPLPFLADTIKITTSALTDEFTFLCPITGLVVPTGLPAFPGIVLDAYHPIAYNGIHLARMHVSYLEAQSKATLAAIFLAAMHAAKKLSLESSALLVNTTMQAALSTTQLLDSIYFVRDAVLKTRRGYPAMRLSGSLTVDTFNDYFTGCISIENYEPEAIASVQIKAPKMLSSSNAGKVMDKECYEAWLEVAQFLPKAIVAKAGPFVKSLATMPADNIPTKLAIRATEVAETLESFEAILAASEFSLVVKESRKKANGLGFHRTELESLFGDEPAPSYMPVPAIDVQPSDLAAARTSSLSAQIDSMPEFSAPAPAPKVEERLVAPTPEEVAKLSFSERVKLRKAGLL